MTALRNAAIVALLALLLTILPGGGNLAEAILTTLSLLFFGLIGLLLLRFWEQASFTRDAMTDRQRNLIYGGLGAIAFAVVGTDELLSSGPGVLLWVALLGGSGWLIFTTWREANSY